MEELFTGLVAQLEVDNNVDGDEEMEDETSDRAGEKEGETGDPIDDDIVAGVRVDDEDAIELDNNTDVVLDVQVAGRQDSKSRKLSPRKKLSLYCDEDQLTSIWESHYSFPKTIMGETYDAGSDCVGNNGFEVAQRRRTIREYVFPYKDQAVDKGKYEHIQWCHI